MDAAGTIHGEETRQSAIDIVIWWDGAETQVSDLVRNVRERWQRRTGLAPDVWVGPDLPDVDFLQSDLVFVVPAHLEFTLFHKEKLAEWASLLRRTGREAFFDEPDPSDRYPVQACVERAARLMAESDIRPTEAGLILLADGRGDARSRAQSYQLMRLLWEHLGVSEAEVVFQHHSDRDIEQMMPRLAAAPIDWVVIPQSLGVAPDLSRLTDSETEAGFNLCEPTGDDDAICVWIEQRLSRLWDGQRKRDNRIRSAKRKPEAESIVYGATSEMPIRELSGKLPEDATFGGDAVVATPQDSEALAALLDSFGIDGEGPIFVKVTWHGYATGTYTDPVALDRLLNALPGPAVLVEGHTIGKNRADAVAWDWDTESEAHRDWILQEERAFLDATGLQDVMDRHRATYLNVTEAVWDGQCVPRDEVLTELGNRGFEPTVSDLCDAIPSVMFEHLDRPLISFARFKGPTRLSVSNCFGLLPGPYRGQWHGPDLTYFARVCAELARIYGTLFSGFGLNEAFNVGVRWDRGGLYRSRWGHYDLVPGGSTMTMSRGFAPADYLACRLQGQDPNRSAFYDNVSRILGTERSRYTEELPESLMRRFV